MNLKPCITCGKPTRSKSGRVYCRTEECAYGFARWWAKENVDKVGDCEIWRGSLRSRGNEAPNFDVTVGPGGKRRVYRVISLREEDPSVAKGRNYENECGNPGCVSLLHNKLITAGNGSRNPLIISAHLPAEPLLDYFARSHRTPLNDNQREALRRGRSRGYFTVTTADTLCIDVLGVHPTAIYGDLFYEAA